MRTKWIAVTMAVLIFLVGLPILYHAVGPAVYGRLTAPHLSSATYKETRYNRETMCILICSYSPKYNYYASGSQKEIINSIANDLEKLNATFRQNEAGTDPVIGCYGNIGDRYQFRDKSADIHDYFSDLRVTFFSEAQPGDKGLGDIGCGRSDRPYRIELEGTRNTWLGLG